MAAENPTLEQAATTLQKLGFSKERPLKLAWFSFFPIEWQNDVPEEIRALPKRHPATWQTVLLQQFEGLPFLDLHIVVVRSEFARTLAFKRNSVTFHCLKSPPGSRVPSFYWIDTFLVNGVLLRFQPDLVHGWGSEFGGASIAARLPYRSIVTMQGILTWLKTIFPLNRFQKVSAFLEPRALRKLKFVTCESTFAMQFLRERWPHLHLIQVEHAPNPVFRQVIRKPQLAPVKILCVSSFSFAKGVDVLLMALEMLKQQFQPEVIFVGNRASDFELEIQSKVSPEVWKRCTLKNNLTPAELAEELATATFVAYPTRADNSPNAVKEAVVAGVPVIASRVGGIADYVRPDKNGLLFEAGNVNDCAAAIQKAMIHPRFGQGSVEPESLAELRAYLSPETMSARMLLAYAAALPG